MTERKIKVLMADDDEAYLKETTALLEEGGYEAVGCQQSRDVLSRIRGMQPDCVVLDLKMPFLDGEDLLLLIRRKFPLLPIIICTGMTTVDERYLLKSGASDVLHKPFAHAAFFMAINQAVSENDESTPIVVHGFSLREIRDTVLQKIIVKALARCNFNITHTAALLGISRQCLLRYIKRLQISY